MDAMTIVEIRNEHPTRTHHIDYYRTRHTLKPNGRVMVPWECAISVLGDPRIYNTGRLTARRDEVNRLRRYWGMFDGFDTPEQEAAKLPQLAVYDQDGERIWMLMDDAEGNLGQTSQHLGGGQGGQPVDEVGELRAQVQALLANQNRLLAVLEAAAPGKVAETVPTLATQEPAAVDPLAGLDEPELDLTVQVGDATIGTVGTVEGADLIPAPAPGTGAVVDSPRPKARAGR